MPRKRLSAFTPWLTAEMRRIATKIARLSAKQIAAWTERGRDEPNPHRLLDYAG